MPRIKICWIVGNPSGPDSVLADILREHDLDTLDHYILGVGPRTWRREMHTCYLGEDEARADAEARLRAVAQGLTLVRRTDGRVIGVTVPGRD